LDCWVKNSAGKTTAIRVVLGLTEPDAGSATVLGLDSRREGIAIRRRVGYVAERPSTVRLAARLQEQPDTRYLEFSEPLGRFIADAGGQLAIIARAIPRAVHPLPIP
jgi:ABC-type Na+ transport system ATPase subunit NatA